MASAPLVSIVIPTYNCARYVGQAVQSVLDQTVDDFEIIVVDDGSDDHTLQVIEAFGDRVDYIRRPHRGWRRPAMGVQTSMSFGKLDPGWRIAKSAGSIPTTVRGTPSV